MITLISTSFAQKTYYEGDFKLVKNTYLVRTDRDKIVAKSEEYKIDKSILDYAFRSNFIALLLTYNDYDAIEVLNADLQSRKHEIITINEVVKSIAINNNNEIVVFLKNGETIKYTTELIQINK